MYNVLGLRVPKLESHLRKWTETWNNRCHLLSKESSGSEECRALGSSAQRELLCAVSILEVGWRSGISSHWDPTLLSIEGWFPEAATFSWHHWRGHHAQGDVRHHLPTLGGHRHPGLLWEGFGIPTEWLSGLVGALWLYLWSPWGRVQSLCERIVMIVQDDSLA